MTDHTVSKLDAARRQLECAIRLYFSSSDAISIHTLSSAARNVLIDICAHRGVTAEIFRNELVSTYVKPEHAGKVRDRYRQAENFFKHADRDPDGIFSFNPEASDYVMFEATEAFSRLTGESTPYMLTFRTWWLCNNTYMHSLFPEEARDHFAKFPYKPDQRALFFQEILPKWGSVAR